MSAMVKTFANQARLPRLPIPSLSETLQRYLRSTQPLFASRADYDAYARVAADFGRDGGLGQKLQARLEAHDKTQPNSWLEAWWLRLAYLSWRESVLVNSNWFMLVGTHPETPRGLLTPGHPDRPRDGQFTDFQLHRAAGQIANFLNFKDQVDNETIPPEASRTGPFCMNQYRFIFGISRIPRPECDEIVGSHPSPSKHIIVLARDQFYVVHVYDPVSGKRLSIESIRSQLDSVIADVKSRKTLEPPVGLLSGEHRDTWAKWHGHLVALGGKNTETFKWIDTALFAVCLDDRALPLTLSDQAKAVFHNFDARNRWFDKCLQVVITNDARVGVNGEHSPCDALVPAYAIDFAARNEPAKDPALVAPASATPPVRRLEWTVDGKILQAIRDAQTFTSKLIGDSDVHVLHYKNYGADFIKKFAKVSPDAFIQMCLQLTFYRMHNDFAAVYETASTRKFLHGRTETCRSLSLESQEFIRTVQNPNISDAEKFASLQKACKAHVDYISAAMDGRGVDRHMLGLRLVMKEGESSEFFKHPVFAESTRWRLSTSGLFPSERMEGTGFGAAYPDGYGMNYAVLDSMVKIGIESKNSCKATSSAKFATTFSQVLDDLHKLCSTVSQLQPKM
ncbi:hypothetical protein HK105_207299 [Polyrhizophydium stewartii]|uniref:Choline/carnitine acyltransferase domain-containing protein n=1 Tax=Polyrhizophydium stewartii TaxID=2732419 RepID=A0ABR4N108_9FUNG|nr:hypothetical protein HK105_001500 [Polyrhizophydium stewartii]